MYKPLSITISDFRLIHQANIDLANAGLVHVGGVNNDTPHSNSNMAGKSTLIHAITWCLYGCDATGLTIASSVLRPGIDRCSVQVNLLDPSGNTWFVKRVRYRNPPPGTPTTVLSVNGTELGSAEDVQHHIDAALGTRELFLAAHVFSYGEKQTPFATASPKDKQALFELLLPGEDLETALNTTQSKRNKMRECIEKYERIATALRRWVRASKATRADNEEELGKRMRKIKAECNWYEVRLREAKDALDQAQTDHANSLAPAGNAEETAMDAESELQTRRTLEGGYTNTIEKARKKLDALKEKKCPTCSTILNAAKLGELRTECKETIEEAKAELRSLSDRNKLHEAYQSARELADKAMEKCDRLLEVCNEKERVLTELSAKYHAHKCMYDELDATLAARSKNTVVAGTMHIVEEIGKLIEEAQDYDQILEFWEYGFGRSGIQAYRLDQVTPTMNKLAKEYSNLLFGDGTSVIYSTQKQIKSGEYRDKFDLYIETPGGDRAEAISAGQFMRRDLIHLFTTVKLAAMLKKRSVRLLVFDEAFRTLDAAGTQATIAILRSLLKDADTILVVEHNDELTTAMDQQITITREQGFSSVSGPHVIV